MSDLTPSDPPRLREPGKLVRTAVTNEIAEYLRGNRILRGGGQVGGDMAQPRAVLVLQGDPIDNRSGWFGGSLLLPQVNSGASGDLATEDITQAAGEDDCYVVDLSQTDAIAGQIIGDFQGRPVVAVGPAPLRPCRVQQSGGSAGTSSTTCTFTYDIYALDNTTKINTTGGVVTPKNYRLPKVVYTAATYGQYFIDADGSYALFLWNENPAETECA